MRRRLQRATSGRTRFPGHHRLVRRPRDNGRCRPAHGGKMFHPAHRRRRHPLGGQHAHHAPGGRGQGRDQHRRRKQPGSRRCGREGLRQPMHRRRHRREARGSREMGRLYPRRADTRRSRRRRVGEGSMAPRRGRDSAHLHGRGRHPGRLRLRAHRRHFLRNRHPGHRFRRRGEPRPHGGGLGKRQSRRRPRRLDLPLRDAHRRGGEGALRETRGAGAAEF